MENLLITPDETIELAFAPHDQIDPAILTDTRIEATQLKFLRPALKKFYAALTGGLYEDFRREYIKPALAYFVKYHIFLHLSVRIGNDGIIRLQTVESRPANASEIGRLRRESRETAYLLLDKAFAHLKTHAADYPEFDAEDCRCRKPRINSGMVI